VDIQKSALHMEFWKTNNYWGPLSGFCFSFCLKQDSIFLPSRGS
jgi:hypothetical protein